MTVFFFLFFFSFSTVRPLSYMLLPLLVLLWARGWFDQKARVDYREVWTKSVTLWAFLALGLLILVHAWGSAGEAEWIKTHLNKYARFFYGAMIIMILYNRPAWQKAAFYGFVSAMLFILASTWLNIWFLLPWSKSQNLGLGVSHHVFGDYLTQGLMMSFFAVVAMYKALDSRNKRQKFVWIAVSVLAVFSITHLLQGRTGFLTLLAAALACLVVITPGYRLLTAAVTLVGGFILVVLSSDLMVHRLSLMMTELQLFFTAGDYASSVGHRAYNWQTTMSLIAERPWLGHGTGAYHTEICRHIEPNIDCSVYNWHPHNQFLLLAADHGIIGALLYAILIFSLFFVAKGSDDFGSKILLSALGVIVLVNSMINSPIWSAIEGQFSVFMIGLLVSSSLTLRRKKL